jgi:pSer/pThr/pTyr-binding forkhead associated (FHA) protein
VERSAFANFKPAAVTLDEDDEVYEATQFTVFESAPEQPEHFLYMIVDGRAEKQFPVNGAGLRIGRSAPAEVILIDKLLSRRHCRVELSNDELIVVDLGSTNGTFVDNEKVEAQTILPVGSVLKVGECQLVHELHRASARV